MDTFNNTTPNFALAVVLTTFVNIYAPDLIADTAGVINIGSDNVYTLSENHHGAIRMLGDNSQLDCNGHTIFSDGGNHCIGYTTDCGIEIIGDNNDINFCRVIDHTVGVAVSPTAHTNKIHGNSYIAENILGVLLSGDGNSIEGQTRIFRNQEGGIYIIGAVNTYFLNNIVFLNGGFGGLMAIISDQLIVDDNIFRSNGGINASFYGNRVVVVRDNTFVGVRKNSHVEATDINLLLFNTAEYIEVSDNRSYGGATQYGFYFDGSASAVADVVNNFAISSQQSDCFAQLIGPGYFFDGNVFGVNDGCE